MNDPQITVAVLRNIISEEISKFLERKSVTHDDLASQYMSRHEACKALRISIPTLMVLSKDGALKPYKIGGRRILYKKSEVEELINKGSK
jgi:excisionase family DNA binding protein